GDVDTPVRWGRVRAGAYDVVGELQLDQEARVLTGADGGAALLLRVVLVAGGEVALDVHPLDDGAHALREQVVGREAGAEARALKAAACCLDRDARKVPSELFAHGERGDAERDAREKVG